MGFLSAECLALSWAQYALFFVRALRGLWSDVVALTEDIPEAADRSEGARRLDQAVVRRKRTSQILVVDAAGIIRHDRIDQGDGPSG